MALYHTILVRRQDLFDIRYALLIDRLAYEDANKARNKFYFGFRWWRRLSKWTSGFGRFVEMYIIAIIYEYCALCGDYGEFAFNQLIDRSRCNFWSVNFSCLFIVSEYFCTKAGRYNKCPVDGCDLVYCLDCVVYLGKRCIREGHGEDVVGQTEMKPLKVELPPDGGDFDQEEIGSLKGQGHGNQFKSHEKDQKKQEKSKPYHLHRRNKSHHGVLE